MFDSKSKKSSFRPVPVPDNIPDTGLNEGKTGWVKVKWYLVEARL